MVSSSPYRRSRRRQPGGLIGYLHLAPVLAMLGGIALFSPTIHHSVPRSRPMVLGASMSFTNASVARSSVVDHSVVDTEPIVTADGEPVVAADTEPVDVHEIAEAVDEADDLDIDAVVETDEANVGAKEAEGAGPVVAWLSPAATQWTHRPDDAPAEFSSWASAVDDDDDAPTAGGLLTPQELESLYAIPDNPEPQAVAPRPAMAPPIAGFGSGPLGQPAMVPPPGALGGVAPGSPNPFPHGPY